jgi:hypothetical protein
MQVSPSRFAATAAVLVALLASAADAVTISILYQTPYWLHIALTLPGTPGAFGASFANGALGLGHSVTSAPLEFALSLPFNFAAYWLLFRICASVILILYPANPGKPAKTSGAPRMNDEFDQQT